MSLPATSSLSVVSPTAAEKLRTTSPAIGADVSTAADGENHVVFCRSASIPAAAAAMLA